MLDLPCGLINPHKAAISSFSRVDPALSLA